MRADIIRELRETAREKYYTARGKYFEWHEKRSPMQWAREERWIARGQSPLAQEGDIRFNPDVIPWIEEPANEAVNPAVQVTVLWIASGMGKTEGIAMTVMGHSICEEPGNIFSVMPKEESRDKFSRDVVERTIEATPDMNSRFVERKSRDTGRTIGYKRFSGGSMFLTSAGSALNFRGPRAKLIHLGEVDGMPEDVDGEGDPIFLAFRRAEGFENSIKIIEGTGTFAPTVGPDGVKKYNSRIHYWYEQGDQRKWFIPCRKCGHLQFTKFKQIWFPPGKPEKAVYLCEQCEADHNDAQRIRAVLSGKWIPNAPFSGVRSYWLNAFSATFPAEKGFKSKLHQFVVDAERAGATPSAKKVWINTVAAELTTPETEGEPAPDWKPIYDRRETYATTDGKIIVPAGGLVMTAGLDVHPDRVEINKGCYGEQEEFWHVDNVAVPGDIRQSDVWKAVEQELIRKYPHALGGEIGISLALCDAGHGAEHVLYFLKYLRGTGSPFAGKVRACRGSNQYPHPVVDIRYSKLSKQLHGHWVGGDEAKDLIYQRLRLTPDEGNFPEGFRHYGMNADEKFFEQLTAERVTLDHVRGEEIRRYKNSEHMRNEALDTSVYGLAAFRLRRWNFAAMRKDLTVGAGEEETEKPAEEVSSVRRSGGGWAL